CHSPTCSHQGGVVHWNEMEQTWDCPVHGGRFAANGERIYGPPESRLKTIQSS
ncbi:MAG: Rieske 2Fe-2S domain-containing protein, partial [Pirellulaceae bacterium]